MTGSEPRDGVGRQIGLFSVGLAVASFSGFVGLLAFALPGFDTDPDWWPGCAAAHGRLADHPGLAVVVGVSAILTVGGIVAVAWALLSWPRAEPGDAADRGLISE